MADLQCAAHVPLSRSGEEQEELYVLALTQLVIAELNGEHTTALMHNNTGLYTSSSLLLLVAVIVVVN